MSVVQENVGGGGREGEDADEERWVGQNQSQNPRLVEWGVGREV